jgi:hypothetical protein
MNRQYPEPDSYQDRRPGKPPVVFQYDRRREQIAEQSKNLYRAIDRLSDIAGQADRERYRQPVKEKDRENRIPEDL